MKSRQFVVCVDNREYPASLEIRKIYEALPDEVAERAGQIRVIDESGQDYLYAAPMFVSIDLPKRVQDAIDHAA